MRILDKFLNKKTNFKAGGLILEDIPSSATYVKTPDKFVAPKKLDFRDMCIETSDQATTPHCVGYATAGYLEVQNWRVKHYPEQIDGDAIYNESKKLDGYNGEGTYARFAVIAAKNLGLTNGAPEYINNDRQKLRFAIHENLVCIGSFSITNEWDYVGKDGIIPNWKNNIIRTGGHAVLCCGYDDFGVYLQNSWSFDWGLYGFATLSWEQFDRQFQHGIIIRN